MGDRSRSWSIPALPWSCSRTRMPRAGLRPRAHDDTQRVSTANGVTRVAPMLLEKVSIGDISVRNVEAAIGEPGKLGQSLLGMAFLGRLQRVAMRAGVLFLQD